jgi:hypothetical protein
MPRLQPPPGCTTARDAADRLGVSEALLSRYVKQGKLKRYGPEARQHKFYKISEIEALITAERYVYMAGQWKLHPTTTFERATEQDMPAIVEISRLIFGDGAAPVATRLTWLRKNPETFFTLRCASGAIVGYASLLPMRRATIDRFIRDEIDAEDITAEEIERFEPGRLTHLYIMAIGIDPRLSTREKHEYGAALVRNLFAFFFDLAGRGVEIETLTARSHKPDGLRLLRKLGIPQLRSPVPGKSLFVVRVPDSGFPLFERYTELLREWQQSHQERARRPVAVSPLSHTPQRVQAPTAPRVPRQDTVTDLPSGTLTMQEFAAELGIARRTLLEQVQKYDLPHTLLPSNRPGEQKRVFTIEQQAAIVEWRANRT